MPTYILDNEGKTIDRYTVIINDKVFTMSEDPHSCMGFNQYAGDVKYLGFSDVEDFITHCEMTGRIRVDLDEVNDYVNKAIAQRIADEML